MPHSRTVSSPLKNYLETSSSGEEASDGDEGSSMWQRHGHRLGLGALAILGVIVGYVFVMSRAVPEFGRNFGTDTPGVIDAPEFRELLHAQSRELLEHVGASQNMKKHIDTEVEHVHKWIKNHLSKEEKETLNSVRLSKTDWNDLKTLCRALADERVQEIGQLVIGEVRQNLLSGPAEIGEKIQQKLQKPKVEAIVKEVLPQHLRDALRQRWGPQPNGPEVWRMLLDPTGDVFQKIRKNETHSTAIIPSSASLKRRLRDGDWKNPKLNGWELAEGITSIVFISAAELMLHLDLLIPQMKLPAWVHAIWFLPAYAMGAGSCVIGLSFWCKFFLGALGVNSLDALIVMSGVIPQSYLDR